MVRYRFGRSLYTLMKNDVYHSHYIGYVDSAISIYIGTLFMEYWKDISQHIIDHQHHVSDIDSVVSINITKSIVFRSLNTLEVKVAKSSLFPDINDISVKQIGSVLVGSVKYILWCAGVGKGVVVFFERDTIGKEVALVLIAVDIEILSLLKDRFLGAVGMNGCHALVPVAGGIDLVQCPSTRIISHMVYH